MWGCLVGLRGLCESWGRSWGGLWDGGDALVG